MWGCLYLFWQWRGHLCVAFCEVCGGVFGGVVSGEVVSA